MRRQILGLTALGFVVALGSTACDDKGLMQKAGEKVDRATDQDKVIGKGPVERGRQPRRCNHSRAHQS